MIFMFQDFFKILSYGVPNSMGATPVPVEFSAMFT